MIRTFIALFITLALAAAALAAPPAVSPPGKKSAAQQEKPAATKDKASSRQQPSADETKPDTWTWFGMGFESRRSRMGDDDFHMAPRAGGSAFGGHSSAGGSANGR